MIMVINNANDRSLGGFLKKWNMKTNLIIQVNLQIVQIDQSIDQSINQSRNRMNQIISANLLFNKWTIIDHSMNQTDVFVISFCFVIIENAVFKKRINPSTIQPTNQVINQSIDKFMQ